MLPKIPQIPKRFHQTNGFVANWRHFWDWLVDGKRHYGDGLYKRAAEITGFTEQTLRDFVWMSGAFELSSRKDNLSFKHHKEAASVKLIGTAKDGKLFLSEEPDGLDTAPHIGHYARVLHQGDA